MNSRTIIAAAAGGLATCAALFFAVYQAQGIRMPDSVAALVLAALAIGGLVFVFILTIAGIHGGAEVIHWCREHIRFQNQYPIRYRPTGEPNKPPVVNSFVGIELGGLSPEVLDPFFSVRMIVFNHTGKAWSLVSVTGLIICARQLCNDPPRMLQSVRMGPSSWDRNNCVFHQRVTREVADNIRRLLADGGTVSFDFGNVQIDGSPLQERYFTLRGPLQIALDSSELTDIMRWTPVLASQHYYDELGQAKPKHD